MECICHYTTAWLYRVTYRVFSWVTLKQQQHVQQQHEAKILCCWHMGVKETFRYFPMWATAGAEQQAKFREDLSYRMLKSSTMPLSVCCCLHFTARTLTNKALDEILHNPFYCFFHFSFFFLMLFSRRAMLPHDWRRQLQGFVNCSCVVSIKTCCS